MYGYVLAYLSPETTTDYTLNDIKNSGFDTLIIFSIDGNASGDLTFFGTPIYTGGVDAIDFNDENTWDATSMVKLGNMMAAIGYKVTLCPYSNPSVWQSVKSQLGSKVDAVNLQCYDGGRNNNVGNWNTYFGGLKVTPLFWTLHADGTGDIYISAQTKVRNWKTSYGIISAGAWQYSDMRDYSGGTAAQFNAAIRAGLQ